MRELSVTSLSGPYLPSVSEVNNPLRLGIHHEVGAVASEMCRKAHT